jgi:hypothetical protein
MRDHALPQDVTSYKFHIIGNMTLKQFGEVAGGVALGFIVYLTNLPTIIKWPIILFFAGVGAIAAFLPIAERPLDQWVVAFFKALYRPTLFFWQRTSKIPEAFLYEANESMRTLVSDIDLTPARRQRVKEYLHSMNTTVAKDTLELYTDQRLQEVMSIFSPDQSFSIAPNAAQPAFSYAAPALQPAAQSAVGAAFPNYNEASTSLATNQEEFSAHTTGNMTEVMSTATDTIQYAPSENIQTDPNVPASTAGGTDVVQIPQTAVVGNAPTQETVGASFPAGDTLPIPVNVFETSPRPQQAWTPIAAAGNTLTGTTPPEGSTVAVPQSTAVQVGSDNADRSQPLPTAVSSGTAQPAYYMEQQVQDTTQQQLAEQAVTNVELPFPESPTEPNKLVGMAIDQQSTPIIGAIIEIRTREGLPARAVKTNPLGQFFISTPLANGTYTLYAEKEGYQFAPVQITLQGQLVPPIEVRSA